MKFCAKVRFNGEKNAEQLIRAIFKEFNPQSSIVIREREAEVEIVFEEPPMEIIEAIINCDIIEFSYGKTLEKTEEDERDQDRNENSKQFEQVEQVNQIYADAKTSEQTNQTMAEQIIPEKSEILSTENVKIHKLDEFAQSSNSYEEFITSIANWLELKEKQDFFKRVVKAAEQTNKISWRNIREILESNGVIYSTWDEACCSRKVTSKFENSNTKVTILKLIKAIVKYKTQYFNDESRVETEENAEQTEKIDQIEPVEQTEQTEQVVSKEEIDTQTKSADVEIVEPAKRIKMKCMPEIPYFEEVLGKVDKTKSIEERVNYVLTAMGYKKLNDEEQYEVFMIANTAVRLRKMDTDSIILKARIPMEELGIARMTFSRFINDFAKNYSDKKVKLSDFLKDLQSIVMKESEIESIA